MTARVLVTSGRLLAGPTDAPVELAAGDFFAFEPTMEHVWAAVGGPAEAVLILSYARLTAALPPA